jgi:hypothetical protein
MEVVVPDLDLVWVFSFDLGGPCNPEEVARRLSRAGLALDMLRFDEKGLSSVVSLTEDIHEDKASGASDPLDAPRARMLEIMGSEDVHLFYEEYRRSHSYVRLKLRGFEATFQELQSKIPRPIHGEAYALIHETGFATMCFWLPIRQSSLTLTDLISLEQATEPMLHAAIWRGLAERYAKVSVSMSKTLRDRLDRSSPHVSVVTSLVTLRNLYAFLIVTQGLIGEVSSIEELERKLRYHQMSAYPVMMIRNVGDDNLERFVADHKFELHGILTKEKCWDWVSGKWVDEALRNNLAWRPDWAVYINAGASLLMTLPSAINRPLRAIPQSQDGSHIELQYRAMDLDVVNIVEVLQLQYIMLRTYDHVLGKGLSSSLSELTKTKKRIAQGLDEYHNVRIWPHKTAQEWAEHGQQIMGINRTYAVVKEKFKLLEGALRTQYDIRLNRLIVALTVLFGASQVGQFVAVLGWSRELCLFAFTSISVVGLLFARLTKAL